MTCDRATPIGFVGLGVMGAGMAGRLIDAGYYLTVHNRTRAKEAPFIARGAASADTPAAVARASRVVFLSLPETVHVEAALFGADGVAGALGAGGCVIDTSSIDADASRVFARRLGERGIAMLDAPVSGGKSGAEQGTLTCMVGGPQEVFDGCRDICAAIATRYIRMGDHGAGQIAKCCNQVAVTGALLGVAEALALARKQGLDPALLREALLGGAARSFSLDKHGQRMIEGNFGTGFAARLMRKDLVLAAGAGQASHAFLPTTNLALQFLSALCEQGGGDLDWSALGGLIAQLSGLDKAPGGEQQ